MSKRLIFSVDLLLAPDEHKEVLLEHPLLKAFSPAVAETLAARAIQQDYAPGEILFHENDPSDFIYAILSGEIALEKEASPGHFVLISIVRENDYFGELGVLYRTGRATRARLLLPCRLAKIEGRDFWAALREEPADVAVQLLGRVIGYLGKSNQRYLVELVRKEKLQFLGEMANAMIHDYKNPLTGIQLALGLIRERNSDDDTRQWCEIIQESTQRMLSMTHELLDFAKGQNSFHPEWVTLPALFDKFSFLHSAQLQQAHVHLVQCCDPVSARLDSNAILRVLTNLGTNAIEAMSPKGGILTLTGRQEGDHVRIEISDTGPGIPAEIRERLFDPFVTFGKKGGSGLGLAIVRRFVEAHNGTITFDSCPTKGTRFAIRLPLDQIPDSSSS